MGDIEFLGNLHVNSKLVCETGLQIGGNKETTEIGGIDQPVIRNSSDHPYVPGSSLKGKMRTLVEWKKGLVMDSGDVHACSGEDEAKKCPVCRVFGSASDEGYKIGPTRLIVRDAFPTEETIKMWKEIDTDLLYTEWKKENTIDRLSSRATPRDFERVPENSEFQTEFVFGLYNLADENKDIEFIPVLFEAMDLLEDSYLGGSGTRGYGEISFDKKTAKFKSKKDYQENRSLREIESLDIERLRENPENILGNK
ncbi:type III-A CRISPR-associated RAMP protein Csm3 [Methanonatronarchaeum sp. AMET-Sl]|uniref:type III-A CRISPR-associated RAMP protein Csm3 n=1 Tax=Methanonatronarchaeum sp. AMET-Sl TaxID=3037654 RepID=UPI00244DAB88|nr:type III-A CRISPR-associated RAMP protein Csm3 [Methanonatronarchaeum sp. AMET-Sl]WGI17162.1 type III-A CRISPR-associated RAMP protein Csm3 [Methanonatronarchaeum sp. AMET-Sl]